MYQTVKFTKGHRIQYFNDPKFPKLKLGNFICNLFSNEYSSNITMQLKLTVAHLWGNMLHDLLESFFFFIRGKRRFHDCISLNGENIEN